MKTKKSRIPEFKTIAEEAHFWDTHSFVDFEDELRDVKIVVQLEKPKSDKLIVTLEKEVKRKLEQEAKNRKLDPSGLINLWLSEKLRTL